MWQSERSEKLSLHHRRWVTWSPIIIYSYSYVMRFWSQIVAFYFLQFINVWISVMMVLFHNTECGNKGNTLKSWLLLSLLSLFSLRLHRFSLLGCHVMNERLKPEDSGGELINSLSGSNCIGLAYEAVTWWTNDSKNPKTRNRWTNSVQNLYVAHARLNESLPEMTRSSRVTLKIPSKWTNRSRPTHH